VSPLPLALPPALEYPIFVGETALGKNFCRGLVHLSDTGYSWGMTGRDTNAKGTTMTDDRWTQDEIANAAAWYVAHSTDAEIQAELNLAFRTNCGYMIHILMHAKAARAGLR
jgi:hypothetical protein